jgi:hypothetical protein
MIGPYILLRFFKEEGNERLTGTVLEKLIAGLFTQETPRQEHTTMFTTLGHGPLSETN